MMASSKLQDIADVAGDAPIPRAHDRGARAGEYLVCAAACLFVIAYLAIALYRMAYPFDLEWEEGSTVDHVRRIMLGQKIYAPPSLGFIAFVYPPLYYYVSAAVSLVTGVGLFPLRLVSFISSGACFWLIYRLVTRETGSRYAGIVALGTFAASYRIGGAWFDLARVDSLFLALTIGALYVARVADSRRDWMLAGVLLALSALTKQTALLVAVPLVLYAAVVSWRSALVLAATFGGVVAAATLELDLWHSGWYLYYVVGLPARIQDVGGIPVDFWRKDIVAAMPVASAVSLPYLASRGAFWSRSTLFYVSLAVGLLGGSWLSRLHSGAYDNVLIPAYACLAILFALAAHELPLRANPADRVTVRSFVALICVLQFGLAVYDVRAQVPSRHDVDLQQQLMRVIAAADGEVYMASHGFFATLAGKSTYAHSWAISDILRAGGDSENQQRVRDQVQRALEQRRFRLVILDRLDPWLQPYLDQHYTRVGPALDSEGLWTVTGYRTRPRWVYVPRE